MLQSIPNGYVLTLKQDDLIHLVMAKLKGLPNIVDIIPAYNSIGIIFKQDSVPSIEYINLFLEKTVESVAIKNSKEVVSINVCYNGPDLEAVAIHNNLTIEKVIEIHTSTIYTVAMIGFLPGFTYLHGLDERLYTPRKKVPVKQVKRSSIAIAGKQTGIYPSNSPGGWQVLGIGDVDLFDVKRDPPNLFEVGDKICFKAVSKDVL